MSYMRLIKKALRSPVGYVAKQVVIRARQYWRRIKPQRKVTLTRSLKRAISDRRPPFPAELFEQWTAETTDDVDMIHAANLICNNHFGFFGSGPIALGPNIDWHYDFINKKECPREHVSKISYAYTYEGKDIKVPWELSRFQFITTLARAYKITKIEKYSEKTAELILDWIEKNPVGYGINWRCPMDLGIQLCNWLIGLYLFEESPAWKDKEFREKLFTSFAEHGYYIEENLEYGPGWNSNHFLGDISGLLFLGALVPEFKEASRWKKLAHQAFEKEMLTQVYEDGADFEGSIPYHRLVTEFFGFAALLCREQEIPLSQTYMKRLEKMFEFTWFYTKPNGFAPQIGDADDGRLFILDNYFDWNRQSHTHLFQVGSVLFPSNNKFAQESQPALKQSQSRAFHDTGIYVMRAKNLYCIVDAGPNGQNGNGGHGHNDTLSFELSIGSTDFIVDPGTYLYTSNPAERNHFRSTQMHNTVFIDNQEINRFRDDTLFGLIEDSKPTLNRWDSDSNEDYLDVVHNGYEKVGVSHQRVFELDKNKEQLEITDSFSPTKDDNKTHKLQWNFHFNSDINVEHEKNKVILTSVSTQNSERNRLVISIPNSISSHAKISEDYISPSYGVKHRAKVLTVEIETKLPANFNFKFTQ